MTAHGHRQVQLVDHLPESKQLIQIGKVNKMVKKFTDNSAFDGLSQMAKETIEMSRHLENQKVTPGVKTEIIWPPEQARSIQDTQEILEFWLSAEDVDLDNSHEFRTDGTLSTFLYKGFLFNTYISDNPIFPHSKMLLISCYVYAPERFDAQLLEDFCKINHPGSFKIRESDQSPTGYFAQYENYLFGEHKSLQFAIGTVMNLSISLASQLIEIWPQRFPGKVLTFESLDEIES